MLELPESYTIARQLRETVLGKTIGFVQAAQSPHGFAFYWGEPAAYPEMLLDKQITDAYALAGFIEICAEDRRLLLGDGVNLRYLAPGEVPPKKHQLYLRFTDGSALVCTVQMYGALLAFPAGGYENPYYQAALEKPSPLSKEFDQAYFATLLGEADPKKSVKAFLATQQRIPGLGNGCLQDILWNAKINPQSKLGKLSNSALESIYPSLRSTLQEMAGGGGRDTEKDLFGRPGGYPSILSAKTLAYPCRRCGGGLLRKAYMGGNVYFCPSCQPNIS